MREETAAAYAAMLSAGITPVVHEYGSLGCSGDLAPLAHCALAAIGEGEVRDSSGTLRPAADALAAAGIEPVVLAEKEGRGDAARAEFKKFLDLSGGVPLIWGEEKKARRE